MTCKPFPSLPSWLQETPGLFRRTIGKGTEALSGYVLKERKTGMECGSPSALGFSFDVIFLSISLQVFPVPAARLVTADKPDIKVFIK